MLKEKKGGHKCSLYSQRTVSTTGDKSFKGRIDSDFKCTRSMAPLLRSKKNLPNDRKKSITFGFSDTKLELLKGLILPPNKITFNFFSSFIKYNFFKSSVFLKSNN